MIFKNSNFSKTDNKDQQDTSSNKYLGLKIIADSLFSYVSVAGSAALSFLAKATAALPPTDSQHDADDDNNNNSNHSLSRPLKRKKLSDDSNQSDSQKGDLKEPIPGQFPDLTRKNSVENSQQQADEKKNEEKLPSLINTTNNTNHNTSTEKTPFKEPNLKLKSADSSLDSRPNQSFMFGSPVTTPTKNNSPFFLKYKNNHGNSTALNSPVRQTPAIFMGSPFSFNDKRNNSNSNKSDSPIFSTSPIIPFNSIQTRQFPSQVGGGNVFSKNPMITLDNTPRSSSSNNSHYGRRSTPLYNANRPSSSPSIFAQSPILSRVFSSTPRSRYSSPSLSQTHHYDLFVPKPKIPLMEPQRPPSHSIAANLYQQILERRERELQEIEELKKQEEQKKQQKLRAPVSVDTVLPLTDDQLDEVKEIWSLRNFNQEIVMAFRVPIYVRDLHTLRHGSWLNDSIIDFYLSMITARSQQQQQQNLSSSSSLPKVFSFTTHFYSTLQNSGYQGVRRWAKRKQIDVTQTDYIFVPINRNNAHWCLAVINNKARAFEFYDSMNGSGHQALAHLKEYMKLEARNVDPTFDVTIFDEYKMYGNGIRCPQQQNAYDCGVFVCKFVEVLSREGSLDSFSQKHMPYIRERMVYEIIHIKLLS